MTDLDDALTSAAPVYYPAALTAAWAELPPGEEASGNADTMRALGGQIGPGGFTVTHSIDDGLPDPVTMTNGNDASGVLEASLVGRQGVYADSVAWRTNAAGGTGTGTTFTATLPTDTTWGDYSLVAIAVNSNTVTVTDANANPDLAYGWQLLGVQDDGSGLKVWLWGRDYYATGGGLSVVLSASASYSWVAASLSARAASGFHQVDIRPGTVVSAGQTVSTTSHTSPSAVLDRRGYLVGVWARVGGAAGWTAGTGTTEINEAGSVVDISMTASALRGPGEGGLTATSAAATAVAVLMTVPLRIMDRPDMTARRFFSPLNRDSPLYGWSRDTASVTLDFNVLTNSGVQAVQMFRGQMADLTLEGDEAKMPSVSERRIALNAVAPLPPISRRREGCTVDTAITWLMAQGGAYVGPGPSEDTRLWYPMYDSAHPFMDGGLAYGAVYEQVNPTGLWGVAYPETVQGPFVSGMHAYSNTTSTRFVIVQGDKYWPTTVPGKQAHMHDMMSKQNSKGRISFWIRGDAYTANPWVTTNDPNRDYIFYWRISAQSKTDAWLGGIMVRIMNNRQVRVTMGDTGGLTFVEFAGSTIPTDNEWHFVGISWDWVVSGGKCIVQVDGWSSMGTGYTNDPAFLPDTEAKLYADGGYMYSQMFARLPVSDIQVEAGPECWSDSFFVDFERFWPEALDSNTIYRRIGTPLEAVANDTPVSSWEALAELARNTLSAYRCDEEDRYNFLPLEYFGENDQMTSQSVADTELNAGELDVKLDASRIRNVVTLNYKEARVDSYRQPIITITSAIYLPRGTSIQVFPVDVPIVEVHGAVDPYGGFDAAFELYPIDAFELITPSTIPNDKNWMSVNSREDGTGTHVNSPSVRGRIVGWNSSSVTVKFINSQPVHMWVSHNVNNLPFMKIFGYAVRTNDAYTTVRAESSVRKRGERALSSDMNWIQSRGTAEVVATQLLNVTSKPRPELQLRVVGDPRRKPGQLVTVQDSADTQAEGTWRVLSVQHNGDGPQYTQDLHVVQVNPVLVWGQSPGWGETVWG